MSFNEILGLVMLAGMIGVIFIGFPISFTLLFLAFVFGSIGIGPDPTFNLAYLQIWGTMKDDILPAGITPTTAAINHVVHADAPTAKVVLVTGEQQPLDPSKLEDWVTVSGGRAAEVAYVELGFPSDLLKNNVVLVDTPGVNDLNEQRAEVTYGYVPRADAVVFLLDAGQALKDSEREFLRSRVLESARDRLIFVLGKMDMLSADERTAVLDYVRGGLAKMIPDPVVYPLSAKDWV